MNGPILEMLLAGVLASGTLVAGCSRPQTGCVSDSDCKRGRTCVDEICVFAGTHGDSTHEPPGALPSASGVTPTCGNGRLDPGETCDRSAGARCIDSCPTGDACDDVRRLGSADRCDVECVSVALTTECLDDDGCCPASCHWGNDDDCDTCGDGVLDPGEECDDGDLDDDDGCNTLCRIPSCGNQVLEAGEVCFGAPRRHAIAAASRALDTGDFDGDGATDLILVEGRPLLNPDNRLVLAHGDGRGGFVSYGAIGLQGFPTSLTAVDFDADGLDDFVVTFLPSDAEDATVARFRGTRDGPLSAGVHGEAGGRWTSMTSGDFDGDGLPDLALLAATSAADSSGRLGFMPGRSDGFAAPTTVPVQHFEMAVDPSLHDADLAGDPADELIVVAGGRVEIRAVDGGLFGEPTFELADDLPDHVASADVDDDGVVDLLVGTANPAHRGLWLGLGDGTFSRSADPIGVRFEGPVATGHFDDDPVPDVAFYSTTERAILVALSSDGDAPLAALEIDAPRRMAAADINGDCLDDLLLIPASEAEGIVTIPINAAEGHRCPSR